MLRALWSTLLLSWCDDLNDAERKRHKELRGVLYLQQEETLGKSNICTPKREVTIYSALREKTRSNTGANLRGNQEEITPEHWIVWDKLHMKQSHEIAPKYYMRCTLKHCFLFIWNPHLTRYPVFISFVLTLSTPQSGREGGSKRERGREAGPCWSAPLVGGCFDSSHTPSPFPLLSL